VTGLLAELESPEALLAAARALRSLGYARLEAYSPYPVPGLEQALALPRSRIPWLALPLGALGGAVAYAGQYWLNGVLYPLNVGARPRHAAPALVPITFETTVLVAATATVIALFRACGLPRLWHPLFEIEGFERASIDRFFLIVDAADPRFEPSRCAKALEGLGASRVVVLEG
jgi:hypothetical protein